MKNQNNLPAVEIALLQHLTQPSERTHHVQAKALHSEGSDPQQPSSHQATGTGNLRPTWTMGHLPLSTILVVVTPEYFICCTVFKDKYGTVITSLRARLWLSDVFKRACQLFLFSHAAVTLISSTRTLSPPQLTKTPEGSR